MSDELGKLYVTAARARGMYGRRLLWRYPARHALGPIVNSLGVLLQAVTNADVLLNYQWHFIPALFFIALVLAFVFVGDGLRDAADPYSDQHR